MGPGTGLARKACVLPLLSTYSPYNLPPVVDTVRISSNAGRIVERIVYAVPIEESQTVAAARRWLSLRICVQPASNFRGWHFLPSKRL